MRTAIQLYTLRDADRPLPDLLSAVGETPLDGVEFAGLGEADPAAVAEALDAAGLSVAGAHVGADALEPDLAGVRDRYARVGCDTLVVPHLPESAFETAAAVEETAARLGRLGTAAADAGARLAYHNHDHEFRTVAGTDALERLLAAPDAVRLEFDAGWALAAGRDPAAFIRRYGDRIPLVHVKDVDAERGVPVELGEGDLDVAGVVAAAREAGVEWLVYEHDEPTDPMASLDHGAETLTARVGGGQAGSSDRS